MDVKGNSAAKILIRFGNIFIISIGYVWFQLEIL